MLILDNALEKLASENKKIKVAVVGIGFMGKLIVYQISTVAKGMKIVALSSRKIDCAREACLASGLENFSYIDNKKDLDQSILDDRVAITDDAMLLCESDFIDVIVEVTGSVEFGTKLVIKAFECKKNYVTMNAELEATLGSIIGLLARQNGVRYTLSDGDQPGVQMNLWRFVKGIGMKPLVCGNIKGLHDEYRNPDTQKKFAEKWGQNTYMVTSFADGSKISFEQACVANATGMTIERTGMKGGSACGHIDEICESGRYDLKDLIEMGGIVDYTVGTSPGPGVFILASQESDTQKKMLSLYKLGQGPLYSFYTPYHLCHFEIPNTIARLLLFDDVVLSANYPMIDVIAIAKKNLYKGDVIDPIGGFATYGKCYTYRESMREFLLPHGLSEGCILLKDKLKDEPLTYNDVIEPQDHLSHSLRKKQNLIFNLL